MSLPPGTRLGPYEVLGLLGAGGMGEVYRARDPRLGRDVAVKVLPSVHSNDRDRLRRFEQEARAAGALNHPSILAIHDVGTHDETPYVVSELLEGESLRERLGGGALTIAKAVEYAVQIAQGVAAAHAKGIVHRDLKPENLFLTHDGRIKILDFGLAKLTHVEEGTGDEPEGSTVTGDTKPGAILGTAGYMSPEQVAGGPADHRSDIFSLGAVLYELLTGRRAFKRDTNAETMHAILREDPPALSGTGHTPIALARVVERCLEKRAEDRFQSAHDVAFALQALSEAPSSGAVSREPFLSSRLPFIIGSGLVVVLLFALDVGRLRQRLGGGAQPASIHSVAVLPLQNLSGDPEQEYFADGMTDALISNLAKIGALKVISRTSAMRFKGTKKLLPEIAHELNVDAVVEGSVLRSGDRVRISAQLIQADSDRSLWAESYDRSLRDILALQSEVARAIAQEVRVKLTPEEGRRLAARPSVTPEAYEAYLRGRYFANQIGPDHATNAADQFREATKIDPTYAPAFSGLASALVFTANLGTRPSVELMPLARSAARKSLLLDPNLAEGHTALGSACMFYDYDWPCAAREFKLGADLNPGDPEVHHWYAHYWVTTGDLDSGLAEIRRARELDPLAPVLNADVGSILGLMGRDDEAFEQNRKLLELLPGYSYAFGNIAATLARQGRFQEAVAALEKTVPSERGPRVISSFGHYYARAGNRGEALRRLAELQDLAARRYVSPYEFARIYIGLGDKDRAFEHLDKAYEARNFGLMIFKFDPEYDPIRPDPRFHTLLKRIGLE